ncbi:hypothetical protein EYC80_010073 [Monilinia laxa]|uniref:Uncharacterized protein n=1 Tax=Monilinia laxa TaxID=61186 RepID=A0A5N6JRJ1_MONLA|nr:hypothetical protein EYC80_010073 [Monilinia laxa]
MDFNPASLSPLSDIALLLQFNQDRNFAHTHQAEIVGYYTHHSLPPYFPFRMVSPDYNDKAEEFYQYDLDDWAVICQYCLNSISATRPPIYHEVNCGCSELGTYAAGITPATQPDTKTLESKTTVFQQSVYTYLSSTPACFTPCTQSSTFREEIAIHESRNDFQNPSINFSDGFHKNDTSITQDQPYSVQSYSWPLCAWLKETESSYHLSSTPRNPSRTRMSSSMKAKNGSKRGNSSIHSSGSGTESGGRGWDPDPFVATGAWADERYHEGLF